MTALGIQPDNALAHNSLGHALVHLGRIDEAQEHFSRALDIQPDFAPARQNLDALLLHRAAIQKLLTQRRQALGDRPHDIALLNDTAWLLATTSIASLRDGAEAVELAKRAVELSRSREPAALGTLDAAQAEAGCLVEAARTARKAVDLATSQNKLTLAESIRKKMPLYEARLPYRCCDGK
jgi:tetratricopeptide (TPR) repeat protein